MNALFRHSPDLRTYSRDGWNFILVEEKEIEVDFGDGKMVRFMMPVGTPSDGASIPEVFASFGFTRYGTYWPAAYAHDAAYRKYLLRWDESARDWIAADLTEAQANQLILALMFSLGTGDVKRKIIYDALVLAGKAAYDEDAKAATKEGRV